MDKLLYFFVFLFGSAIGSFLNVVIYRLESEEEIVKKRSHCVNCGQTLRWPDLIPLFSFFYLGGRCRYCHKKISWQYPLVELLTGLIFVLIFKIQFLNFSQFFYLGFSDFSFLRLINFFYFLYAACSLLVIFVFDLRYYFIPDKVLLPLILITFFWRGYLSLKTLKGSILLDWLLVFKNFAPYFFSALGAFAFFLAIILITRGKGMGFGDAKLVFLLGLILGWPKIFIALFLSFFIGSLVGLALILIKKKSWKSSVPFGPFLIGATVLTIFFGQTLIKVILPFYYF